MKLKKKAKKLVILLLIIVLLVGGYFIYDRFIDTNVKESITIDKIPGYGYKLKDNKPLKYIKMFIFDFYSLKDKTLKTDIGGVEFVHPDILTNFVENAENTYYKNVQNNLYGKRKQSLPAVDNVKIKSIEQDTYKYNNTVDDKAYKVKATWTYNSAKYDDYQKEAELVIVHKGKKLYIVESIDPNEDIEKEDE